MNNSSFINSSSYDGISNLSEISNITPGNTSTYSLQQENISAESGDDPAISGNISRASDDGNVSLSSKGTPPPIPHIFFGKIEVDGNPVPAGMEVAADGMGVRTGREGNPIYSVSGGYGGSGLYEEKLIVQGNLTSGTPIMFFVDGMPGLVREPGSTEGWQPSYPFVSGAVTELDIRVGTAVKSVMGIESLLSVATWDSMEAYPAIFGDRVVWTDYRSGYAEIYLYNLTSGEELKISHSDMAAEKPDIWEDRIVWQDWRNNNYDIYMFDMAWEEEIQVTNDTFDQINPRIWGNRIVWEDWRNYENYIYLYDISSGSEKKITEEESYESNPAIYENYVVWEDWRNQNYDIYMYDLDTGIENRLTTDSYDQVKPGIWANHIVWEDYREGWSSQIYCRDMGTGNDTRLTAGIGSYSNPVIYQDLVVYENKTLYWDISAYDLNTGDEMSITQYEDSAQMNPDVSDDRIVWWDGRNGNYDIYMYTLGISEAPLVAGFSANKTKGDPPLTVQFYDGSMGPVAGYRWDFGDGNYSTEKDPIHTYQEMGTYTPILIVNDPYQRDAVRKIFYISVGSTPVPDFSVNARCGPAPFEVRFNDTSSGLPDSWYWDFGDGYTSYEQNPVHIYTQPGVYDINLTAGNSIGESSVGRPGYITVLDGTYSSATLCCDGISVVYAGDTQVVSINSSMFSYCAIDPSSDSTIVECIPPPATGLSRIILESTDGSGFTCPGNGMITGNLTGIVFRSEDNHPLNFSSNTGTNCMFNYTVELPEYPGAGCIDVVSWEGCSPDDYPVFNVTAKRYNYESIESFAYSAGFTEENCSINGPVTVIFAVSSDWVKTHGWGDHGTVEIDSNMESAKVFIDGVFKGYTPITVSDLEPGEHTAMVSMSGYDPEIINFTIDDEDERESIHLLRIGDEEWGEVLETQFLYHDPETNLDYFRAESPHGLSTFGLASLSKSGNPIQVFFLTIMRLLSGGSSGGNIGLPEKESTPIPTITVEPTAVPTEHEKPILPPDGGNQQPKTDYPTLETVTPGETPVPDIPLPPDIPKNLFVVFVVILITAIFYFRWRKDKGDK